MLRVSQLQSLLITVDTVCCAVPYGVSALAFVCERMPDRQDAGQALHGLGRAEHAVLPARNLNCERLPVSPKHVAARQPRAAIGVRR